MKANFIYPLVKSNLWCGIAKPLKYGVLDLKVRMLKHKRRVNIATHVFYKSDLWCGVKKKT